MRTLKIKIFFLGCTGCYPPCYWITLLYIRLTFLSHYEDKQNMMACALYIDRGSKGIIQWPINWCTSPMIIHKIPSPVEYNFWLKHFDIHRNESTHQNSLKVHKVLNTFETSVINSKLSLSSWYNILNIK